MPKVEERFKSELELYSKEKGYPVENIGHTNR